MTDSRYVVAPYYWGGYEILCWGERYRRDNFWPTAAEAWAEVERRCREDDHRERV